MIEARLRWRGAFQEMTHHAQSALPANEDTLLLEFDTNHVVVCAWLFEGVQTALLHMSLDPRKVFDSCQCDEPAAVGGSAPVSAKPSIEAV